jgi:hypothetical protein
LHLSTVGSGQDLLIAYGTDDRVTISGGLGGASEAYEFAEQARTTLFDVAHSFYVDVNPSLVLTYALFGLGDVTAARSAGAEALRFAIARGSRLGQIDALLAYGRVQLRTGVFHEDLSPGQRDIEVAQLRLRNGPSMLLATECGGEGRNFEFCDRIVLFDLLEPRRRRAHRRLDASTRPPGRDLLVRPPAGLGSAIAPLRIDRGSASRWAG